MHPYLGDLLIRAKFRAEGVVATQKVAMFLQRLGWIVNFAKNYIEPAQDLIYLGARFDTAAGLVLLPEKRAQKLWI